jgi:PAS domain S-box-containing protein
MKVIIGRAAMFVWVLSMLIPSASSAQESAEARRVLVLYWYNKDYSWNINFDRAFQAVLHSSDAAPFEYYPEYLESNRFPGENQSLLLRDYLRQKYADRSIDVVVANSDASLDFLLKYRDDLFPKSPIVFITTRRPAAEILAAEPGSTGLITLSDHRKTVDLALSLHPNTKEIFVISGTLQHDKRLEAVARAELRGYENRVQFSYLTDRSPDELIAKVKTLPKQSLVLYIWQQTRSEQGEVLETERVLASIAKSVPVPIYGMANLYIGAGVVGGYINTADATGTRAAEIVIRVANGARPRDIAVESAPIVPIFDWRELRRWGIREDELPAESVVRLREETLWTQHKLLVIGTLTLIVAQAGLIGWLLIERRRRRLAERMSRDLAAIVESSGDAIIGLSLDGEILSWNSGAESLYGYTLAEVRGRHISIIIPPDRSEESVQNLQKRRRGEPIQNFETVRLRKDGTSVEVSVSVSSLKDVKGRVLAIASITRDISERKRAELEMQRLTSHLLHLQDEERRRIARELHDVTAQNMFVVSLNLSRLQGGRVEPPEAQTLVTDSRDLCEQALQEIRTLAYLLHPPMLDLTGLSGALKWYVAGFVQRSGISITLFSGSEIGRLSSDIETALFRIVQESLTNIRRHSGSSSAEIRLEREEDQVLLQIKDHGRGMPKPASVDTSGVESLGVGIAGMRQRIRQLGGILEIDSSDQGMTVNVRVPIPDGNDLHLVGTNAESDAPGEVKRQLRASQG